MKRAGNSFWPGQATQEERRHTRKNIILEDVGITSATLGLAVSRMAPVLSSVSTEADLDEAISDWIQEEFESGTPLIWWGMPFQGCTTSNPSSGERPQELRGFTGYGASLKSLAAHPPSLKTSSWGWRGGA